MVAPRDFRVKFINQDAAFLMDLPNQVILFWDRQVLGLLLKEQIIQKVTLL